VVSESIRNPHELAAELTRRSAQGWEVVQIVFDGATWFHAFIRHEGMVGVAPFPGAGAPKSLDIASGTTAAPVAVEQAAPPVAEPVAPRAETPVAPSTAATVTSSVPASVSSTEPSTPAPASEPSVPEVPANWYKDPSGRFELRYWNGTAWTEHVATGGRQSVDPPKA